MAIDREPRRYSRRTFLGILAGATGLGAVGGAIAQREIFRYEVQPYEALRQVSQAEVKRLENLVKEGRFTQLEPVDWAEGGVDHQPVIQYSRARIEDLTSMLADYDLDTGRHMLQQEVADVASPGNYLNTGLNHLVLHDSDTGHFEIVDSNVRVFASVSGGPAGFALINPTPQELDHSTGFHLSVLVNTNQDGRPDRGIRPIAVVLPK